MDMQESVKTAVGNLVRSKVDFLFCGEGKEMLSLLTRPLGAGAWPKDGAELEAVLATVSVPGFRVGIDKAHVISIWTAHPDGSPADVAELARLYQAMEARAGRHCTTTQAVIHVREKLKITA